MTTPNTTDVADDKPMVLKQPSSDDHKVRALNHEEKSEEENKPQTGNDTSNSNKKFFSKFGKLFKSGKNASDSQSSADKEIAEHMKASQIAMSKTLRLLLLGAGGSGKSTVFKQMEKLYRGKDDEKQLEAAKEDIYRNIITDIYDLCKHNVKLNSMGAGAQYKLSSDALTEKCLRISNWTFQYIWDDPLGRLTRDLALEIDALWRENAMRLTWQERKQSHVMDNTPYFFDKILDIVPDAKDATTASYRASFDDFVRVRDCTTGIIVKAFRAQTDYGEYMFEVTDVGGQRAERRKWMRLFDNISVCLYIMALSAYDQCLFEDNTKNCWDETLELFSKTAHEAAFGSTDWVIFFNKVDLFEAKIAKIPFSVYQTDFNADDVHNSDAVKKWILDEFRRRFYDGLSKEQIRKRGNLYFHVTCATNEEYVSKIIQRVHVDLIKSQMKKMGYLM
eukprot:CAMPEP_0202706766 /NCGR_PEP_ID=MMETSP1385-20130828/19142_1 /ASSEMBLY_ACC=CAM_ASM_000861 /TAXON_ID=933848 /ORGANISM="Elphidium margaritaceum" /LENGTH=447 /DNA_ID=CAMNT_0049365309 /DNA_START=36 /DNA_END=1379 /DNA_ORIENTATION=+